MTDRRWYRWVARHHNWPCWLRRILTRGWDGHCWATGLVGIDWGEVVCIDCGEVVRVEWEEVMGRD